MATVTLTNWSSVGTNDVINVLVRNDTANRTRPQTIGDVVVVPVVWSVLYVVGVLGNGLVLYVMMRHAERQTTNCFITNLALSDLTFITVVIPMTMMHYVLQTWTMGEFMCRFNYYMTYVSGADYFAAFYPLTCFYMTWVTNTSNFT